MFVVASSFLNCSPTINLKFRERNRYRDPLSPVPLGRYPCRSRTEDSFPQLRQERHLCRKRTENVSQLRQERHLLSPGPGQRIGRAIVVSHLRALLEYAITVRYGWYLGAAVNLSIRSGRPSRNGGNECCGVLGRGRRRGFIGLWRKHRWREKA